MRRVLPLLLVLVLVACARGYSAAELTQQLQAKLDAHLGKGTLELVALDRKGSYTYSDEADQSERLLIYYDAELRFARDVTLSNWDQLNVGSLIWLLGATPRGVRGVKAEGNKTGDGVTVHGTLAFRKQQGTWIAAAGSPHPKAKRQGPNSEEVPRYRKIMEQIAEVGSTLQRGGAPDEIAELERGLTGVLRLAQRRLSRSRQHLTLSTGREGGTYAVLGQALVEALARHHVEAEAFGSDGSVENCRLVGSGEAQIGLVQNDTAYMAYNGTGPFEGELPLRELRALASLYPEALHVATLARNGVRTLGELKGRRIDLGVEGSGGRFNALHLLQAAGLRLTDFDRVQGKPLPQTLEDLRAGRVDAVFLTAAYPAPALLALGAEVEIELISLQPGQLAALEALSPSYLPVTIAEKTYPGMSGPCQTAAVTAMLAAHAAVPDERIAPLLDALFESVPALARQSVAAYYIDPARALQGVTVPLHPAAARRFGAAVEAPRNPPTRPGDNDSCIGGSCALDGGVED